MSGSWKTRAIVSLLLWTGVYVYLLRCLPSSSSHFFAPKPAMDSRIIDENIRLKIAALNDSHWSEVIAERKNRVNAVCRNYREILRRFMNHNRLLFDTKHHLAYCRNAKAGTTNWLSTLLAWAGEDIQGKNPEQIHDMASEVFPNLGPEEAAREMQHPAITFSVVRHPFTRLVSAYRDKMPENYKKDLQESIISKYRQNSTGSAETLMDLEQKPMVELLLKAAGENISNIQRKYSFFRPLQKSSSPAMDVDPSIPTFREFVLYVSDRLISCGLIIHSACLDSVDVHWQPYHNRCAPCDINYSVIAKMETFNEDQKHIRCLAAISENRSSTTSVNHHTSEGQSTISLARMYFSQLSPMERMRLYIAYYFDFQLFGYSPDDIVL